jgi:hypothetical protein
MTTTTYTTTYPTNRTATAWLDSALTAGQLLSQLVTIDNAYDTRGYRVLVGVFNYCAGEHRKARQ